MRSKIVPVKNVVRLAEAGKALIDRPIGLPGMGLIHGFTGAGKTTATTWFIVSSRGIYVRAMRTTTPSSFLASILRELDMEPRGSCAQMVETIVAKLAQDPRPIFIDEADYIIDKSALVDTARDIHDMSMSPVILIGMAGIQRKIAAREQLSGRIARSIEFQPLDLEDARLLADMLCEVEVEDDILADIHEMAGGSMRLMVVGLSTVESRARASGKKAYGLKDWPKGEEYFIRPKTARRAH